MITEQPDSLMPAFPTIARRGVCLVISAPSGAGKSTIVTALRAAEPQLKQSVSVTTRAPRPGEAEGVHYYFRTMEQFTEMTGNREFLEWAVVFGRGYGTLRRPVEEALISGRDIIFDVDWQGHRQMREALPYDVVSIFILPPSLEELERRLRGRASDSESEISSRMAAALDEISHWREFDHVIVNTDIDQAVAEVSAVLTEARLKTQRQTGLEAFVAGFVG